MEGSDYVEATMSLYERLRADQPRTGICLQAYLKRTASDVERLRPLDPAIRLVKGAYDEPAIDRLPRQAAGGCELPGDRGRRPGPAAGDRSGSVSAPTTSALIEQIAEQVEPAGVGRDGFEVEMLYGIRPGAISARQGRLPRPDADRVRGILVPVVYASPGGTAGQCRVRDSLTLAVVLP